MTQSRPLSIRQTLWLAIGLTAASVVLGASALYGYRLYCHNRDSERLRVAAMAETYAAQVAPLMAAGARTKASGLVEDLAWHWSSSLIAILSPENRTVAVRGNTQLLKRYLALPEASVTGAAPRCWNVPGNPDRLQPELSLAAVPIQVPNSPETLGTLVYAARVSRPPRVRAEEVWRFFICLALIAATGTVLGLLWLKQKVLVPLAHLAEQSEEQAGREAVLSLLTRRPDEIGEVARVLADVHLERNEWRGRAVRLERSVSDRVAAQTHKITRELRRAQKTGWTDPLTGLGNRRLFDEKFVDIFHAQEEAGQDLSIVMVDVDHFKTLNDTLGHHAGDELLAFVGELLKQCLREQDLAVRYGGDEFLLILPSVRARDAQAIAERLIRLFAQQTRLLHVQPNPTMSAGIASLRTHGPATPADLVELADQALYQAKNTGRSQVALYRSRRQAVGRA